MIRSLKKIEKAFRTILSEIPFLDQSDENLADTPARIARMYHDMFWGLDPAKKPKIKTFPLERDCGIVGTGKIFFSSMCAHHFLPFHGHATIFYLPGDRIVGLSKLTRIVQYYAARPQLQERLAVDIAECIMDDVRCQGVYVVLRAQHGCLMCRGVRQERAVMVTPVIRPLDKHGRISGPFARAEIRQEALSLMEMKR